MTNTKGSEPARPVPGHFYDKGEDVRADFAKEALNGMLAHSTRYKPRPSDAHLYWHDAIAKEAVELADALIAALSERK